MLYKLCGRSEVEEVLTTSSNWAAESTVVTVCAPAWMPTAADAADMSVPDRWTLLYYACHLYFAADTDVSHWIEEPLRDPLFSPLAQPHLPMPFSLGLGLALRYTVSLAHPMGTLWPRDARATLPDILANGAVKPSDLLGLPPLVASEVNAIIATVVIAWHIHAKGEWHLRPRRTEPWPEPWPQEPLDLRPNARALLVMAWWRSGASIVIQLAQLLNLAEEGFPPPHCFFSGSLWMLCNAAGDQLDDPAVFAAIARQWAYLEGYLMPPADPSAKLGPDAAVWEATLATAHAATYRPWREKVLAAWPRGAFPPRKLALEREQWVTRSEAVGRGDVAVPPTYATVANGIALAHRLRTLLQPPRANTAGIGAAGTGPATPSAVEQRLAAVGAVQISPVRLAGAESHAVLLADEPASTAPPSALAARLSVKSRELPIVKFADEIVARTRQQRLLCIQVRRARITPPRLGEGLTHTVSRCR